MTDTNNTPQLSEEDLRPKGRWAGLKTVPVALASVVGLLLVVAVFAALYFVSRAKGNAPRRPPERAARAVDVEAQARAERNRRERGEVTLGPRESPPPFRVQRDAEPQPQRVRAAAPSGKSEVTRAIESPILGGAGSGADSAARSSVGASLYRARTTLDQLTAGLANPAAAGKATPGDTATEVPTPTPGDPAGRQAADRAAFIEREGERATESRWANFVPPESRWVLHEGALLPAVLIRGVNSDLPGQAHALLRADVYDSVTGVGVLLPEGTKLIGSYDSRVVYGDRRVLIAWRRAILPDGRALELGGMPGVDIAGAAGVDDLRDNHLWQVFGSAIAVSAISAGLQLSQPEGGNTAFGTRASTQQVIAAAIGQEVGRTADQILRRGLQVAPTLKIRPGYAFNVELTVDLYFDGPYRP